MTKSKVIMSTLGVLAAAGAVVAGVLVKKRGQIKVEGQIETKGNGAAGRQKKREVKGAAKIGANRPT